jgi:hypothetical protein
MLIMQGLVVARAEGIQTLVIDAVAGIRSIIAGKKWGPFKPMIRDG